jgi:hypothetical protein
MSYLFSDVPVRTNDSSPSGRITAQWWNILRLCGMALSNYIGTGFIEETAFTFANTQGVAADITGCLFSSASVKTAHVEIAVRRTTASVKVLCWVHLYLGYNPLTSAWEIMDHVEHGDASGLTFSVSAAGQVKYTSDTTSGTGYSGASRFRANAMGL